MARLDECLAKLTELAGKKKANADAQLLERFTEALDNDLNVSAGWGAVFEWVRDMNRAQAEEQLSPEQAAAGLAAWEKIDKVFGLGEKGGEEAPPEFTDLLAQRQAARQAKDFARADALRDELKAKGWIIDDTPKGPRLKKA